MATPEGTWLDVVDDDDAYSGGEGVCLVVAAVAVVVAAVDRDFQSDFWLEVVSHGDETLTAMMASTMRSCRDLNKT